jgi:hypothetical protein
MDRLILLEQTTPKDKRDGFFLVAVLGGGNPGGVEGRGGRPETTMAKTLNEATGLNEACIGTLLGHDPR